ncbi:hypothetical protein Agub_g10594 [Astrephomene gubernaculifera]|uniref:BRCT domain-containing protein n=1 Tax=Astrephomene gubernaculifera TaxID=47775 RepID=A0AAD3DY64_9CHLO|nr:hypothetical protein Agub_g10594 [Astrephomene gubernaculifera]
MADTLHILERCCVHVYQRVDGDARAVHAVCEKVKELGGKAAPRLSKEVTHVIFQRKLNSSYQERLLEDELLREIYKKAQKNVFVVSPLWLQHSQDAGKQAKEARYLERRPPEPLFITASPDKSGNKRKRKSFTVRPRETLELADINDAMFSSSQQIRELTGAGCSGVGKPVTQLVAGEEEEEEEDEEPQPKRQETAVGVAVGRVAQKDAAGSSRLGGPAAKQPLAAKGGLRQMPLNFAVIPKKPLPPSLMPPPQQPVRGAPPAAPGATAPAAAANAGAAAAGPGPVTAEAGAAAGPSRSLFAGRKPPQIARLPEVQQPAPNYPKQEDGRGEAAVQPADAPDPGPATRRRSVLAEPPPASARKRQPPPPSPAPQAGQQPQGQVPSSDEATGQAGSTPQPTGQATRYPALSCLAVSVGGAKSSGAGRPLQGEAEANQGNASNERGGDAATGAAAAPARPPSATRGGRSRQASPLHNAPAQAVPTPGSTDPAAGPRSQAAAAAGAGNNKPGGGALSAAVADAVALAAAMTRTSGRRGSRSCMGTPVLGKGKTLTTPTGTPQGLTPVALVVPRLKSQGSANPSRSGTATPEAGAGAGGPSAAAPAEALAAAMKECGAAEGAPLERAGSLGEASPTARRRKRDSSQGSAVVGTSGSQLPDPPAEQALPVAVMPVSVRRSTRARAGLPPTPPPAPSLSPLPPLPPAAPASARAPQPGQGALELGSALGSAAEWDGGSTTPVLLGAKKTAARASTAGVGRDGEEEQPEEQATPCLRGMQQDGMEAADGGKETQGRCAGNATGRKTQRKGRKATPLQLSPVEVAHGGLAGNGGAQSLDAAAAAGHAADSDAGACERTTVTGALPAGQTPGSVLRRSTRIAACSPLVLAPSGTCPTPGPGAGAKQKDVVAEAGGGQAPQEEQQQQPDPGQVWEGFKPPLPPVHRMCPLQSQPPAPPPASRSRKRQCHEGAGSVETVDLTTEDEKEEEEAAKGPTPLGRRNRRRGREGANADRAGPQHPEVFVLPSPALCTRSRSRAAATPPPLQAADVPAVIRPALPVPDPQAAPAAVTEVPQTLALALSPLQVPARNPSPSSHARRRRGEQHSEARQQQQLQPSEPQTEQPSSIALTATQQAHAGVTPITASKYMTRSQRKCLPVEVEEGPSCPKVEDAAMALTAPSPLQRPGSVTRSRRRALDTELSAAAHGDATSSKEPGTAAAAAQPPAPAAAAAAPARMASALQTVAEEGGPETGDDACGGGAAEQAPPRTRRTPSVAKGAATVAAAAAGATPAAGRTTRRTGGASAQKPPASEQLPAVAESSAACAAGQVAQEPVAAAATTTAVKEATAGTVEAAQAMAPPAVAAATALAPPRQVPRPQQPNRLRLQKRAAALPPRAASSELGASQGLSVGQPAASAQTTSAMGIKRCSSKADAPAASLFSNLKRKATQDAQAAAPSTVSASLLASRSEPSARQPIAASAGEVVQASAEAQEPLAPAGGANTEQERKHGEAGAQAKPFSSTTGGAAAAVPASKPSDAAKPKPGQRPPAAAAASGGPAKAAAKRTESAGGKASRAQGVKARSPAMPMSETALGASAGPATTAATSTATRVEATRTVDEAAAAGAATSSAAAPARGGALGSRGGGTKGQHGSKGAKHLMHTCLDNTAKSAMQNAVRQLEGARLCSADHKGPITHLVLGSAAKRTVKVLLAIANGALFVTPAWVTESLKAGRWLPEDEFPAQGNFAETARAVRALLPAWQQQQRQQQRQQQGAEGSTAAAAPLTPSGRVVAKPLAGRQVCVLGTPFVFAKMSEAATRKADLERLLVALGGELVPARSATLFVALGDATQTAERRSHAGNAAAQVVEEEWLYRLAETHVWQDPPVSAQAAPPQ